MKTTNDNTQIFLDSVMRYADRIIENWAWFTIKVTNSIFNVFKTPLPPFS